MPRPHKCRWIDASPAVTAFKPCGVAGRQLERIELRLDEAGALRLADVEGLYHDAAGERMGVSRATFGRLVESARRKVADAVLNGKMLVIQGGVVVMAEKRKFECASCGHGWEVPFGTGRPSQCPSCQSTNFCRAQDDRGPQGAPGAQGRCRRRRRRQADVASSSGRAGGQRGGG